MVQQDPVDVESILYDELYMPFQGGRPRRKILATGAQRPRYDHQARRNLSAGLLSVHSEVLKEASPILYGANTFTARRAVLLNLFFDVIGARHTHHIKSIRIRLENFTKGSTPPLSRWYDYETVHESGVWPHLPSLHTITLVFDHPLMFCEDLKLQTTRDALSWLNASKPANGNFMYDYMLTARLQPGVHWFIVITGWIGREEFGSGLWDDGWTITGESRSEVEVRLAENNANGEHKLSWILKGRASDAIVPQWRTVTQTGPRDEMGPWQSLPLIQL